MKRILICDVKSPPHLPQAKQILSLFHEHRVLRHVMKVPEELRKDKQFDSNYCALVKALVPTRSRPGIGRTPVTPTKTTPTPAATRPPAAVPPRKPQRKNKLRRSTVGSGESSSTLEVSILDCIVPVGVKTIQFYCTQIYYFSDSKHSMTILKGIAILIFSSWWPVILARSGRGSSPLFLLSLSAS